MGNKYIKSRRSNHEGSIVKRSSGLYQAMIMFDGKRQYHYDRKKQNCVSWLAEMHLKFIRGQPITDNSISLIK